MSVLRVNDVPLGRGQRRVEVTWQDGPARRVAVSSFAYQANEQDGENIRWYLEDYAEFPADPAPALAAEAEARLSEIGTGLFQKVFTAPDAAGIWGLAQARLGQVRVEVDTDPADAPGLPWELLRDPGTGSALAVGAGTFVRTHLQTAGQVSLPEAAGDTLRVLLVICRPGGGDDVPFRSVASRLVRGGATRMEGLHLDVLRPATYPRLAQVLHEAADAGRPYHVVHFDGHGLYLDIAGRMPAGTAAMQFQAPVTSQLRPGHHGYLIFEDPASRENMQLTDGPTLGRLLTATGVPVLLLNACRSAYTEAPSRPGQPGSPAAGPDAPGAQEEDTELADVHARIRAYGSLAAEVADAGVPGVVAMRYNVYVVTAAQYALNLYAHLLSGAPLGHAATAARRALADDPIRQIGATPVTLQDWVVPIVYEAAPLTLFQREREAPLIQLDLGEPGGVKASATDVLPRPPDAGFFGRDETLLALDRAFDTQRIVLLHGYAGAGKTTTVAEFARWYRATGGLYHPDLGSGPVLWSSFEHHLPLDRLLDTVGDCFSAVLENSGIHWQAITSQAKRRDLVLQILAQVPVLWVWDNVEPVTGFPPGTPSAWNADEQEEIAGFLRDLAQRTRCKVLLTSRRDEQAWLAQLPARALLPPMPMRERLQLAYAIAARNGHTDPGTDWRPLLRYTAGNPLTITVLVGQAVRDNLTTTEKIKAFVARLRAGEQELEDADDAALGRTQSLAASLSYGFTHAFTGPERGQLALLHLFRDTVDADALRLMGDPDIAEDDAVPELAGLTRDTAVALLDRAAGIGLLSPLGGGYYSIHPALPWYFTALFGSTYGQPDGPRAQGAARAYAHTFAGLAISYSAQVTRGTGDPIPALRVEEGNLLHALAISRQAELWKAEMGCVDALRKLYLRTGRDREWARLVDSITPDFIDPATDGPVPGRDDDWALVTEYRVGLAIDARNWPVAARLQQKMVDWDRNRAVAALATPDDQLTREQRHRIRTLAVSVEGLGRVLRYQKDPDCLPHYEEALHLYQRIGDQHAECNLSDTIGNAYKLVPDLRDLKRAEQWYQRSLDLEPEHNLVGRAQSLSSLASVAYERFLDAREANEPEPVLRGHLDAALQGYHQALNLVPGDDIGDLAEIHNQMGNIRSQLGDTRQALADFQRCLAYEEDRGNSFGTGLARHNMAVLLASDNRFADAMLYARAALEDFDRLGPAASPDAAPTRELIARLERLTS